MKVLKSLFVVLAAVAIMISVEGCFSLCTTNGVGFYTSRLFLVNETNETIDLYANGCKKAVIPPYGRYTLSVFGGYSNWGANLNTNITLIRESDGKATYRDFYFYTQYTQTQTWIIDKNTFFYFNLNVEDLDTKFMM